MEIGRGVFRAFDADFGSEHFVEGALYFFRGDVVGPLCAEDLSQGVYAGIGSACPGDFDGLIGDLGEGLFDDLLHGASVRLNLPADEIRSVIAHN